MRRKPQEIQVELEAGVDRATIESLVGQEVPLSCRYCLGARPTLIAIEGDLALLRFPNCATMATARSGK